MADVTFGVGSLGCGARTPPHPRREKAPKIRDQHANRRRQGLESNQLAGYGSVLAAFRFAAWAHEQRKFPTPERVEQQFGVSRATAYRWCNALAEAYGFRMKRRGYRERGLPVELTRA